MHRPLQLFCCRSPPDAELDACSVQISCRLLLLLCKLLSLPCTAHMAVEIRDELCCTVSEASMTHEELRSLRYFELGGCLQLKALLLCLSPGPCLACL